MKRKTLNLNEKIKLTELREIYGIGKTSVVSKLKNEKNIRKELEKF